MKVKNVFRILILSVLLITLFLIWLFDLSAIFQLENLKFHLDELKTLITNNFWLSSFIYFGAYVAMAALSVPGALVLTVAGGALYGIFWGFVLVSFASTLGASLAFLSARFIFQEWFEKKFPAVMSKVHEGIKKEGLFYLFALRLVPIFPFFLVNIALGLSKMPLKNFFFVSQLGMMPGTLAYINAGLQISQLTSLSDVLSFKLLSSFLVLALVPWFGQFLINYFRQKKIYAPFIKNKPKNFDFDLICIGAGSAGLVSAYIGSALKAKVALIEKNKMGGDCLNTGCVPSKALIRSAHFMHDLQQAENLGFYEAKAQINFSQIMARVHKKIKSIEPHDSVERYEALGVKCFLGQAQVLDPWRVKVGAQVLNSRKIIIASGAEPLIPGITGLDKINFLHSNNLWELKTLPKNLLILGGGPIGCEMAQCFARLGSKVSLVEMTSRLLAAEDEKVGRFLQRELVKDGVEIFLNHEAKEFSEENGVKILLCQSPEGEKKLAFDEVLVAVGRKANTKGFGLKKLGLKLRANGSIEVDEYLRATFPNIYACGDVTGPYQFTHAASHQAWHCAVNALLGIKKFKIDYRFMPWCTFTDPEIASVGLNEERAKLKNIAYEITEYDLADLDRAIVDEQAQGFVRILTEPNKDRILGVTIVGAQASNLLSEFVLAMRHGLGLKKIMACIHLYPSMAEANKAAAGKWYAAHAPSNILKFLESYFSWRRG